MHKQAHQLILAVTVENKNQFILPMFGAVSVVEKNYELLQPKKKVPDENHFINLYFLSQ